MSNDILDWTITTAPDPDEPPPLPLPEKVAAAQRRLAQTPHAISRAAWLIIGGLMLASVLGLAAFAAWNTNRTNRAVRLVVHAEEQAAIGANLAQLDPLVDSSDANWISMQIRWAQNHQSAPLPLGGLRPVWEAGQVQSVAAFTADTMQANVTHKFIAPDGTTVAFILPQFYHYTDGHWKRRPPPAAYWGQPEQLGLRYGDVGYFSTDGAFIKKDLAPYLDDVMTRACAEWDCPSGFRFSVYFTADLPPIAYSDVAIASLPADGPLLFNLLASSPSDWQSNSSLILPLPHLSGYPADEPSAALLKRAIALQLLAHVAVRLSNSNYAYHPDNAFLYTLVARTAARLGLEDSGLPTRTSQPQYTADILWDLKQLPDSAITPARRAAMLDSALLIVNQLLEQSSQVDLEPRLFAGMKSPHHDATEWLAEAARITANETATQLFAVSATLNRAIVNPADYEFALSCEHGPLLFARYQSEPMPLLASEISGVGVTSWSPDGQHLTLVIADQSAVIDFASREITLFPGSNFGYYPALNPWLSNSVLAYLTQRMELRFFDLADPQRQSDSFSLIRDYLLSPDKASAAALKISDDPKSSMQLMVMPASGGLLTPLDTGSAPAWSPDSRTLAYLQVKPSAIALAYLAPPQSYSVQTGDTLGGLAQTFNIPLASLLTANSLPDADTIYAGQVLTLPFSTTAFTPLTRTLITGALLPDFPFFDQPVWSPDGQSLAFIAWDNKNKNHNAVLALADITGRLRVTYGGFAAQYALPPQFSADGDFIAFTVYANDGDQTFIYNVRNGEQIALDHTYGFGWASTHHSLISLAHEGIYLVEPTRVSSYHSTKLAADRCYNVVWNPTR